MPTDPLNGNLPPAYSGRVDSSRAQRPAPFPEPTDDQLVEGPPQDTISAERLFRVVCRMGQSYYDTPDVRDAIARRAVRDLGSPVT
jgi:hypothetical protein